MKLLVTGAGGFVGSALAKHFESEGHSVTAYDSFGFGSRESLRGFSGPVVKKDVCLLGPSDIAGFDAVLHQAAISDPTNPDNERIMQVNYGASVRLIDMCAKAGIRIAYASSSAIYGNSPLPQKEFVSDAPLNTYALSKQKLDTYAKSVISQGSLVVGLRYFNIYGPGEDFKKKGQSIVRQFLDPMRRNQRPVIYGDGKQARDLVYIKDIVLANRLALEAEKGCIVNAGSGTAVEYNRLIAAINETLGTSIEPIYRGNPLGYSYQLKTQADLTQARSNLGYAPQWDIKSGIEDYLKHLPGV